jgi:phosphoglycolate phosphatase
MNPRGAVVFDLDGTLVDTSGDIVASVNRVRALHSLPALDARTILDEVGRGAAHLVSRMLDLPQDAAGFADAVREFRECYKAHQGESSAVYPGVREALEALSREFDLYVLSNKPTEAAVREVGIQGLSRFFRGVWGGGSLPALKPDPAGVLKALDETGVDASRGAMVGDLVIDLQTGANAGVSLFLVTWGFARPPKSFDAPYEIAATPEELVKKIERTFPRR